MPSSQLCLCSEASCFLLPFALSLLRQRVSTSMQLSAGACADPCILPAKGRYSLEEGMVPRALCASQGKRSLERHQLSGVFLQHCWSKPVKAKVSNLEDALNMRAVIAGSLISSPKEWLL